jgi:hypothetical protein
MGGHSANAASVDRVYFNNGTVAVRKRTASVNRVGDPMGAGPQLVGAEQQDAEELAAQVAEAVGVRVPAVHRSGPEETLFELIDGETGLEKLFGVDWFDARDLARTDEGIMLGLLDALIDNSDRHEGNWMIDRDGKLVGIDHGQAFAPPPPQGGNWTVNAAGQFEQVAHSGPIDDFWPSGSLFALHYHDRVGNPHPGNPISPEDAQEIRRRLARLKPEFDRLGRAEWHEQLMHRADQIAARAQGTERRLP